MRPAGRTLAMSGIQYKQLNVITFGDRYRGKGQQ